MPTTLKDLTKLFGFDLADEKDFDLDKFKSHIGAKYISRDAATEDDEIVNKITGKRMGILETRLAQTFGFKTSDLKDKKVEDIIDMAGNTTSKTIERLKKLVAEGSNEGLAELQTEHDKLKSEKLQLQEMLAATKNEYEGFKKEADGKFKNYKIKDKLSKVRAAIPFVDGFNENAIQKTGFEAIITSKYDFDLDENDNLKVIDKQTKQRVKSSKSTAEFATPEEVFTSEAEANKLIKKNNGGTGPAGSFQKKTFETTQTQTPSGMPVNRKALAAAEKAK